MATEQAGNTAQEMDFPTLCRAVADASPMPMAGLGGSLHILRYVNLAFCLLTGKSKDELIGTAFCDVTPGTNECMLLLDRVVKTGLAESHTGQEHAVSIRSTGRTRCGHCLGRTTAISASWSR